MPVDVRREEQRMEGIALGRRGGIPTPAKESGHPSQE
jgi:hypothetical protein